MDKFKELTEVMAKLRSENGCPWDREQTHISLRKDLIEETYEVIDAIEKEDVDLLKEELGDLLLQVIFHTQIEKEKGNFNEEDVIEKLINKLISRHPHVFGDDKANDSKDVIRKWDAIKSKEKKIKNYSELLKDVPTSFPALLRAYKIQSRASKVGFDWDDIREVYKKIEEEILEVKDCKKQKEVEEELGDLLFSVVNLSRFLNIEPESALNNANEKFIKRFEKLEDMAKNKNKRLEEMDLKEMDKIWEEVKRSEKNET